jgi:hypothetical protein
MASLTLPEPIYEPLLHIASLEEDAANELLEALKAAAPAIYRKDVVPRVTEKIRSIPVEKSEDIIEALFSLSVGRFSADDVVTVSDFVEDVVDALPDIDNEKREVFKQRLTQLLDADCLRIGGKAYDLLSEHEHNLIGARILTDLRPIFGESPESPPIGAIVVHTLKINYFEGNQRRVFYVALDTSDVKKLIETLERGRSKASSLKEILATTQVSYVDAG